MPGETLKPLNDIHKCVNQDMQKLCDCIKPDVEKELSTTFNTFQIEKFTSKINEKGKITYCLGLKVDNNNHLCVKACQKEAGGEWKICVKDKEGLNLGMGEKLPERGGISQETEGTNLEKEGLNLEKEEKFPPELGEKFPPEQGVKFEPEQGEKLEEPEQGGISQETEGTNLEKEGVSLGKEDKSLPAQEEKFLPGQGGISQETEGTNLEKEGLNLEKEEKFPPELGEKFPPEQGVKFEPEQGEKLEEPEQREKSENIVKGETSDRIEQQLSSKPMTCELDKH